MNAIEKLVERAPAIEFESSGGTKLVKLGLIITVYYKEGYALDAKKKINNIFEAFYKEFQSFLKLMVYRGEKKLTEATFKRASEHMLKTDPNDRFGWFLGSAASAGEADEYSLSMANSFEVHGEKKRSYLKLTLPWGILKEPGGLACYQDWLIYLSDSLRVEHGIGGLSSLLPYDYHNYMPAEYGLAQENLGLDVSSTAHLSTLELIDHIKGVNWYTIIGNTFIERLGGETSIRQALSNHSDIKILNYNNGLIIRAGEYPELGALEDGPPAAYVAVNNVVKPVRIPNPDQLHTYSSHGNCFDKDSTARWYARFDQDDT